MKEYWTTKKHDLPRGLKIEVNGSIELVLKNGNIPITKEQLEIWALKGMISDKKDEPPLKMQDIINAVCFSENITEEVLKAKTRKREIVECRQYAHYFCKEYQLASLSEIGYFIGMKDHSTVLHSHKTVKNNIKIYKEQFKRVKRIEDYINKVYKS